MACWYLHVIASASFLYITDFFSRLSIEEIKTLDDLAKCEGIESRFIIHVLKLLYILSFCPDIKCQSFLSYSSKIDCSASCFYFLVLCGVNVVLAGYIGLVEDGNSEGKEGFSVII